MLFHREKKRVRLTDAGRLLLERSVKILSDLSRLKDDLASDQVALEGHYRIGSTHSLAARYVTAAWSKLQLAHPKLSTTIQVLRSNEIAMRASISEIDVGFCFGPIASPDIQSRVIGSEPFVLAVRRRHKILKENRRSILKQVRELPCAAPRTYLAAGDFEHPELRRLSIRQNVDFVYQTYDIAIQRLLHSDSWALIPAWYVDRHHQEIAQVDIPGWNAQAEILMVWNPSRALGRALAQLSAGLTEEIQNQMRVKR